MLQSFIVLKKQNKPSFLFGNKTPAIKMIIVSVLIAGEFININQTIKNPLQSVHFVRGSFN